MLTRSRRSFLDMPRWVLAIWIAFAASSVIAPCNEAFALTNQGDQTSAYTVAEARRQAHHVEHVAGKARTTPSDALLCVEAPSSIPLTAIAVYAPAGGAISSNAIDGSSPFFESSSAAQVVTRPHDVHLQVFLETSRLLI